MAHRSIRVISRVAYSGGRRTAFRGEAEQDSGLIPNSIPTGNAVPVVVQVGNVSSQPGVTISVR